MDYQRLIDLAAEYGFRKTVTRQGRTFFKRDDGKRLWVDVSPTGVIRASVGFWFIVNG